MPHSQSATLTNLSFSLEVQDSQIKKIQQSITKANNQQAQFINHQQVVNWLNSWGSDEEKDLSLRSY